MKSWYAPRLVMTKKLRKRSRPRSLRERLYRLVGRLVCSRAGHKWRIRGGVTYCARCRRAEG